MQGRQMGGRTRVPLGDYIVTYKNNARIYLLKIDYAMERPKRSYLVRCKRGSVSKREVLDGPCPPGAESWMKTPRTTPRPRARASDSDMIGIRERWPMDFASTVGTLVTEIDIPGSFTKPETMTITPYFSYGPKFRALGLYDGTGTFLTAYACQPGVHSP